MQVRETRIQYVGAGASNQTTAVALFQILISLQDFDDIGTDNARIALIDQIIADINEARG
jgi:hypothetical protein